MTDRLTEYFKNKIYDSLSPFQKKIYNLFKTEEDFNNWNLSQDEKNLLNKMLNDHNNRLAKKKKDEEDKNALLFFGLGVVAIGTIVYFAKDKKR